MDPPWLFRVDGGEGDYILLRVCKFYYQLLRTSFGSGDSSPVKSLRQSFQSGPGRSDVGE